MMYKAKIAGIPEEKISVETEKSWPWKSPELLAKEKTPETFKTTGKKTSNILDLPSGQKSDVYSFAVISNEIFSKEIPYKSAATHLKESPPKKKGKLVKKKKNKKKMERRASLKESITSPANGSPPSSPTRVPRKSRRKSPARSPRSSTSSNIPKKSPKSSPTALPNNPSPKKSPSRSRKQFKKNVTVPNLKLNNLSSSSVPSKPRELSPNLSSGASAGLRSGQWPLSEPKIRKKQSSFTDRPSKPPSHSTVSPRKKTSLSPKRKTTKSPKRTADKTDKMDKAKSPRKGAKRVLRSLRKSVSVLKSTKEEEEEEMEALVEPFRLEKEAKQNIATERKIVKKMSSKSSKGKVKFKTSPAIQLLSPTQVRYEDEEKLREKIMAGEARPDCSFDTLEHSVLHEMVTSCWSSKANERWTFDKCISEIQEAIREKCPELLLQVNGTKERLENNEPLSSLQIPVGLLLSTPNPSFLFCELVHHNLWISTCKKLYIFNLRVNKFFMPFYRRKLTSFEGRADEVHQIGGSQMYQEDR